MAGAAPPHELEPDELLRRTRSFDHWFRSVEGYLPGLENGHRPLPEERLDESARERLISVLCTYCIGESAALEASSGMVRFAPNRPSQIFLATQAVDEARHVEVLLGRLSELGVADPDAEVERRGAPSLRAFKQKLLRLVDAREWESALFAQNIMLETMEYIVFGEHARVADPRTQDLLERILRDERRHLGFGENEIAACLRRNRGHTLWVVTVKRELDHLVLDTFEHAARELGLGSPAADRLGGAYLNAIERLGLSV